MIISIALKTIPGIRPLIDQLSSNAVLFDTSNYHPMRDGGSRPSTTARSKASG